MWHVVYWIGSALFLSFFYGYRNTGFQITSWFVILLLPISIGTTYFFNYYLIPRFLGKRQFLKFILYSFYAVIISVYLELVMIIFILVVITGVDFSAAHFEPLFLLAGMYIPVLLAIAIRLYREWSRSEEERILLQQKKAEAELKLLKAQLHPHFLFNTLNNLYALSLEKSDQLPDMLLKLSDMLQFILYDANRDKIPLKDEIQQVENYLELEKLRFDQENNIDLKIEGDVNKIDIVPLSILTLVENSFKHGIPVSGKQFWVNINISIVEDDVNVFVSNSCSENTVEKKEAGIGLKNLRSRLDLIYKDNYQLNTVAKEEVFEVSLQLR